MGEGFQRLRKDAVGEGRVGVHGQEQSGVGPFAEAIMRPDHDIGPFAALGGVEKLVRRAFRVLDGDGNARVFREFEADFGNPVVAFVAIDPDEERVRLPRRSRERNGP